MADVLQQKQTDWSHMIDLPLGLVIPPLKAEGWRVISLRCGELSEIVLRRRTHYLTVVARNSMVNTVHMFDTANH